ncbi:MAG TPA: ComEA family DNA-binding protein [Nitrospira sp.]|nr:ComEA family DNA-binding protein [Nitrospira sp.]
MVASLLIRLMMVMLTLTVVCWIGWNVPASRNAETLHAGLGEGNRFSDAPLPMNEVTPSADPTREARQAKSSRHAPVTALNLNRATQQEFEGLPGIGPVLAGRIVEYREVHGAFGDVEQLRRVKGIGKKTFGRIRPLVVVVPQGVSRPPRKAA